MCPLLPRGDAAVDDADVAAAAKMPSALALALSLDQSADQHQHSQPQPTVSKQQVATMFRVAVEAGSLELLRAVIARRLLPRVAEPRGFALELVRAMTREGHADLVRLFLDAYPLRAADGIDCDGGTDDQRAPLLIAAEQDNADLVAVLLRHGADSNVRGVVDGWTALHIAVEWDSTEIQALLVHTGADVNAATLDGDAPLHIAVGHGHSASVAFLLEAGADVNARNLAAASPLHIAAREGHIDIIDMLLNHGADLHALDAGGRTPLHAASFFDESAARFALSERDTQLAVIKALLARGANADARDADGRSPLDCALLDHFDIIVDVLRQATSPSLRKHTQQQPYSKMEPPASTPLVVPPKRRRCMQ